MVAARVMVVDDFKEWRRKTCSIISKDAQLQVIAEAADGIEAVEKAYELKPDVVVLDLGLPKLSGIAAAIRILRDSPGVKILFLSQHQDATVVSAAFEAGALAYVHKIDASQQLLTAITVILRRQTFLSNQVCRGVTNASIALSASTLAT